MEKQVESFILDVTGAERVEKAELIQPLWNRYGELLRVTLQGGASESVILKHIRLPEVVDHPKGFHSKISHDRKMKSYQAEFHWYRDFNDHNLKDQTSVTPRMIGASQSDGLQAILLEDLVLAGFRQAPKSVSWDQVKVLLSWLGCFHAKYLGTEPDGLWRTGTYWHLKTRPEELQVLWEEDPRLAQMAWFIDRNLENCKYKTILHGDAKLANFLFLRDHSKAAAVDFQYIGGGCGMKDVAYLIGSCMEETEIEKRESEILDFYFETFKKGTHLPSADLNAVELEWRKLYPFAVADFHRFIKGWSPGHWKINSYAERLTQEVQKTIQSELSNAARSACQKAGKIAMGSFGSTSLKVGSKSAPSLAGQIVTEIDFRCQKAITTELEALSEKYELGLLAEEESDDQSRFTSEYFWCIDPLDGTLQFSRGESGFAHSVALVHRDGWTLLGVVYDPVEDRLIDSFRGAGCFVNEVWIDKSRMNKTIGVSKKNTLTIFADRSFEDSRNFEEFAKNFDIHFPGGAVVNTINVMLMSDSCYFKEPKTAEGGCALWDLAAVDLILKEAGGVLSDLHGNALNFNQPESLYFNESGFIAATDERVHKRIIELLKRSFEKNFS